MMSGSGVWLIRSVGLNSNSAVWLVFDIQRVKLFALDHSYSRFGSRCLTSK